MLRNLHAALGLSKWHRELKEVCGALGGAPHLPQALDVISAPLASLESTPGFIDVICTAPAAGGRGALHLLQSQVGSCRLS